MDINKGEGGRLNLGPSETPSLRSNVMFAAHCSSLLPLGEARGTFL